MHPIPYKPSSSDTELRDELGTQADPRFQIVGGINCRFVLPSSSLPLIPISSPSLPCRLYSLHPLQGPCTTQLGGLAGERCEMHQQMWVELG